MDGGRLENYQNGFEYIQFREARLDSTRLEMLGISS
jgi:hypothetical protein